MCNCNKTSLCNRCSKGLSCGCPPDYSVLPLPVSCGCCPSGYIWSGPTLNYPNGVCTGPGGTTTEPIECSPCVESTPGQCVILPSIACLGTPAGMTLTDFLAYLCTEAFTAKLLTNIGLSTTLKAQFCDLTGSCPPSGGGAPILGPIVFTTP